MSQFISLPEGITMTTAYRQERDSLIAKGAIAANLLPICETFEKEQVINLMSKPGCKGLRIYLGLEGGEIRLILVGADSQDRDMIAPANDTSKTEDDELLERAIRCPTTCPPPSGLNS